MKISILNKIATSLAIFTLLPGAILVFAKETDKTGQERKKEAKESCLKSFGQLFAPDPSKDKESSGISGNCHFPFGIGKKFDLSTTTPDSLGPVIENIGVMTSPRKAIIRLETNEKAKVTIFYGNTAPLDLQSPGTKSVNLRGRSLTHKAILKHLIPNTSYYFIIKAVDKSGNISSSNETVFITKAEVKGRSDSNPPVISRVMTVENGENIIIAWKTNEKANSRIFYSTKGLSDLNDGNVFSIIDTTLEKKHIIAVPYLGTSTPYHLIVESKDEAGNISRSDEFVEIPSIRASGNALGSEENPHVL